MSGFSNTVNSQLQFKLWACYDAASKVAHAWPCPTALEWAALCASVNDVPSELRPPFSVTPPVTQPPAKYPPNPEPDDNPAFGTW